jgi:hypothetical protein
VTSRAIVRGVPFGLILMAASCRPAATLPTTGATPSQSVRPPSPVARLTDTVPANSSGMLAPPTPPATSTPTLFPEQDLHTVTDDTGAIQATIPVVWSDQRTIPWVSAAGEMIGTTFIASTDIEAYLSWQVEGVSISVTRRLDRGYIQLLDEEYATYSKVCRDPFLDRWDFSNEFHRGKYYVLVDCGGVEGGWLHLFSVVGRVDPKAYTARVLAYDMIPLFGSDFGDIMMMFQVDPDKLP